MHYGITELPVLACAQKLGEFFSVYKAICLLIHAVAVFVGHKREMDKDFI